MECPNHKPEKDGARIKRLLFYSHDSYGLGNIRRMVAIAEYLVKRHSDIHILLLTGSTMLHAFRTHPQIDYIKLPCMQRDRTGAYEAKLSSLENEELISLRRELIKQSIIHFKPDLLLVDKKPAGLANELSDSFDFLSRLNPSPPKMLLLRDILDHPEVTHKIWKENGYFRFIEQHYDHVLIAGQATIFDAAKLYQFPESVRNKTTYLGYLKRVVSASNAVQPESPLFNGSEPKKHVLVAVGGGNDGLLTLKTYLLGLKQASWRDKLQTLLIYGPEMPDPERSELEILAAELPNVSLLEFTQDFISYLNTADLVVSMGGYNTVCEILSVGKPAIIIPRTEPVSEQLIRAKCFSRKERVTYIHPDQLNTDTLMDNVYVQLFTPCVPINDQGINMGGMENIRKLIIEQIESLSMSSINASLIMERKYEDRVYHEALPKVF